MADDPTPDPDPKSDPDPTPDPDDKPDPVADELARTRAALKKANKEAADLRLKEKERDDAGKSELEKANTRVAELEKTLGETTGRAMRQEVALAKGLTAAQTKRLVGNTQEELEADADALLEELGGKTTPGGRPTENLRGGNDPNDEPDEKDPRKLAENVPRR